ncbi:MAG: universal stress protein [Pseudomonadota bacterium]
MTDTPPSEPAPDERIKFLVVASDCEEARRAAFFAGRRARKSNARVILLHVTEPPEFGHWASVAETMRAEAQESARALLDEFAAEVKAQSGEDPELVLREGSVVDELRALIAEDRAIAFLFLGAADEAGGPGPLVTAVARDPAALAGRPLPVVIVPGGASREELRALAG